MYFLIDMIVKEVFFVEKEHVRCSEGRTELRFWRFARPSGLENWPVPRPG